MTQTLQNNLALHAPHHLVIEATDAHPLFSLNNVIVHAKIVHVYDGDSFRICFMWGGELRKFQCRGFGYDTPEMRPLKSIPSREMHIKHAKAAREAFCHQVGFKVDNQHMLNIEVDTKGTPIVIAHLHNFGKYGRLLVTLYRSVEDMERGFLCSVNQWMVDQNYAVSYTGGTKNNFSADKTREEQQSHHDNLT